MCKAYYPICRSSLKYEQTHTDTRPINNTYLFNMLIMKTYFLPLIFKIKHFWNILPYLFHGYFILHFIKATISETQRAYCFSAEVKKMMATTSCFHSTNQEYNTATLLLHICPCVEKLFLLVGLLDLDLSLSKSPSHHI